MKHTILLRLFRLFIFSLLSFLIFMTYFIGCVAFQKPLEGPWIANLNEGAVELLLIDSASTKYHIFNNLNDRTNAATGMYAIIDNMIAFDTPDKGFLEFKGGDNVEYTWERSSDNDGEILYLHLNDNTTRYRPTAKDVQTIVDEGLDNLSPPDEPETNPLPVDMDPPTIESFFPMTMAADVPENIEQIVISFNEEIALGSAGTIVISKVVGGTPIPAVTIDFADLGAFGGMISTDSNQLIVGNLTASVLALADMDEIEIVLSDEIVADTAGNTYVYDPVAEAWGFTAVGPVAAALMADFTTAVPDHGNMSVDSTTTTTLTFPLDQIARLNPVAGDIELQDTVAMTTESFSEDSINYR